MSNSLFDYSPLPSYDILPESALLILPLLPKDIVGNGELENIFSKFDENKKHQNIQFYSHWLQPTIGVISIVLMLLIVGIASMRTARKASHCKREMILFYDENHKKQEDPCIKQEDVGCILKESEGVDNAPIRHSNNQNISSQELNKLNMNEEDVNTKFDVNDVSHFSCTIPTLNDAPSFDVSNEMQRCCPPPLDVPMYVQAHTSPSSSTPYKQSLYSDGLPTVVVRGDRHHNSYGGALKCTASTQRLNDVKSNLSENVHRRRMMEYSGGRRLYRDDMCDVGYDIKVDRGLYGYTNIEDPSSSRIPLSSHGVYTHHPSRLYTFDNSSTVNRRGSSKTVVNAYTHDSDTSSPSIANHSACTEGMHGVRGGDEYKEMSHRRSQNNNCWYSPPSDEYPTLMRAGYGDRQSHVSYKSIANQTSFDVHNTEGCSVNNSLNAINTHQFGGYTLEVRGRNSSPYDTSNSIHQPSNLKTQIMGTCNSTDTSTNCNIDGKSGVQTQSNTHNRTTTTLSYNNNKLNTNIYDVHQNNNKLNTNIYDVHQNNSGSQLYTKIPLYNRDAHLRDDGYVIKSNKKLSANHQRYEAKATFVKIAPIQCSSDDDG